MTKWLSLLVCLSVPVEAQQYLRTVANTSGDTTVCVTWSNRTFTYRVNAAGSARTPGDTEFTAIDSSFASWQAVSNGCSDFTFVRGERMDGGAVGKNTASENLVIFRETMCREVVDASDDCNADGSCGNKYGCWDHSSGTIGLTTVTYSTRTGIAVDADIELNSATYLMTTVPSPVCEAGREAATCVAYDVQNTVTHEIGHAVGFDHVSVEGSTMAPTAPMGETSKRVIDVGTATGFCQTYPRGLPPTPCDELATQQSKIIAESVSCVSATVLGAPWAVLSLLILRRRSKKSR